MTAYTLAFVLVRVLTIYYLIEAVARIPNIIGTISLISANRDQLIAGQIWASVETAVYVVVIFAVPYILWTSSKSIARFLMRPFPKDAGISVGPLDATTLARLSVGLLGVALVSFGLIEMSRGIMQLAVYRSDFSYAISEFVPAFVEFVVGLALLYRSNWWLKRATRIVIRRLVLKLRTVGAPASSVDED